jgi:hypothetical protein
MYPAMRIRVVGSAKVAEEKKKKKKKAANGHGLGEICFVMKNSCRRMYRRRIDCRCCRPHANKLEANPFKEAELLESPEQWMTGRSAFVQTGERWAFINLDST